MPSLSLLISLSLSHPLCLCSYLCPSSPVFTVLLFHSYYLSLTVCPSVCLPSLFSWSLNASLYLSPSPSLTIHSQSLPHSHSFSHSLLMFPPQSHFVPLLASFALIFSLFPFPVSLSMSSSHSFRTLSQELSRSLSLNLSLSSYLVYLMLALE